MFNLKMGSLGRQDSNLISLDLESCVLPLQHPSLSLQLALQKVQHDELWQKEIK